MVKRNILSKLFFALSVSTIPLLVATITDNIWVSFITFPFVYLSFAFVKLFLLKNSSVSKKGERNLLKIIIPKFIYQVVEVEISRKNPQTDTGKAETEAALEKDSPELLFNKTDVPGGRTIIEIPDKTEKKGSQYFPEVSNIPVDEEKYRKKIEITSEPLKIIIADDHAVVRKGLKHIILEEYPSAVIGEAADAEALLRQVIENEWNIVICDMNMPGRSGLDALNQIKHAVPNLPVLIMSMYPEDQYALRVLKAGASGYLGKDHVHDDIIKAIQTLQLGKKFITPSVAEKLASTLGQDTTAQSHETLSEREFDIFKLLAMGKSISEIAKQLSLSVTTVSTYRSRIMEKMGVQSNAGLTKYALEKKLI